MGISKGNSQKIIKKKLLVELLKTFPRQEEYLQKSLKRIQRNIQQLFLQNSCGFLVGFQKNVEEKILIGINEAIPGGISEGICLKKTLEFLEIMIKKNPGAGRVS